MNQKQKIKAYTLLEMIIVIIILTLLIGAFSGFMPSKNNKQIDFGEQCSQYIYQEITTEINNLKRNKIEKIDGTGYFSFGKEINISSNNISIRKKMKETIGSGDKEYTLTIISGNKCLDNNIKNINNYFIIINQSGTLTFTPKSLYITDKNIFEISTCINTGDNNTCIPSSQIIFNQAVQTVDQKLCIDFSGNNCNEWSK